MEARPWYKKVTQYFRRKDQVTPTLSVHEYPLSEPKQKVVKVRRNVKRKLVIQPPSTNPKFNHSLRPSHLAKSIGDDTSGASTAWVTFWLWVIIAAVAVVGVIKCQYP